MNRREAEVIADAIRVYVEAVALMTKAENPSPKLAAAARLAAERMEDALVGASRHG
jgi:hypothetical protein